MLILFTGTHPRESLRGANRRDKVLYSYLASNRSNVAQRNQNVPISTYRANMIRDSVELHIHGME